MLHVVWEAHREVRRVVAGQTGIKSGHPQKDWQPVGRDQREGTSRDKGRAKAGKDYAMRGQSVERRLGAQGLLVYFETIPTRRGVDPFRIAPAYAIGAGIHSIRAGRH